MSLPGSGFICVTAGLGRSGIVVKFDVTFVVVILVMLCSLTEATNRSSEVLRGVERRSLLKERRDSNKGD